MNAKINEKNDRTILNSVAGFPFDLGQNKASLLTAFVTCTGACPERQGAEVQVQFPLSPKPQSSTTSCRAISVHRGHCLLPSVS